MINKAFVINLDSKIEQFQEVQRAFLPYGIECERYIVKPKVRKQLSCTITHLEIIAHAKKEGWPYVFIIEDDCFLQEPMKAWRGIEQFLLQEQKRWDVFLGGVLFPWPRKLITHFKIEEPQKIEMIQSSHGVTAHFVIYNQNAYDRLLTWHDLPLPLEERPNIDNFVEQCDLRIWVPFPLLAVQKPHSNCDWTDEFLRVEKKLRYFSRGIKKSSKYRFLDLWLKAIS